MDVRFPRVGDGSPWGRIQSVTPCAHPGMRWVTTAGHGGCWVAPEVLAELRKRGLAGRNVYGGGAEWFEEDCEWAILELAFPGSTRHRYDEHNAERVADIARRIAAIYYPEVLAQVEGVTA